MGITRDLWSDMTSFSKVHQVPETHSVGLESTKCSVDEDQLLYCLQSVDPSIYKQHQKQPTVCSIIV